MLNLLIEKAGIPRSGASLGAVLLALVAMGACGQAPKPAEDDPTVPVVKVARADLTRSFEIAAEFRPHQEIEVHAKVAGYVKAIYVDIGDRVRKGQLLTVLEIPELAADLEHAQAAVKRSESELERAKDELRRSKSLYRVAHLEYQRLSQVAKNRPDLVAQQEVDDAQGRDQAAEAQVEGAQAGLAAAEEQLRADQATVEKEQSLFDYARITAPFDGVVTWRYADTGAMVAAGTSSEKQAMPVVKLAQENPLRLDIPVPESLNPVIHVGTAVKIRVPAFGIVTEGKVVRFTDELNPQTRTMTTEVDVPNPTLKLKPGLFAYAMIELDHKSNALSVPIAALIRSGDQASVYRVGADGKLELRPVTLGIETASRVEVVSGLEPDALVVVGQKTQLQPGEKVKPKLLASSELAVPEAK
jgi:RND family efflux transporter MFP subunit